MCIGITPVNFDRLARESFCQYDPPGTMDAIAEHRTAEVLGKAERFTAQYLPDTVAEAKRFTSDPDIVEATDYYKTDRGKHPHGCTSGLFSYNSSVMAWDAFA